MNSNLLGDSWFRHLEQEMSKPYFLELKEKLIAEYNTKRIFPGPTEIFKAFQLTSFEDTRIVMIGQDPYPYGEHAHGLAFSSKLQETPASLRYIFRELDRDIIKTNTLEEYKHAFPTNDLTKWANQGVLLLNSCLTVRAGEPNSHKDIGWKQFIEAVLDLLWESSTPRIFVLWGTEAVKVMDPVVKKNLEIAHHVILETGHPASGVHGRDKFSGNRHFSKINHHFYRNGLPEIDWKLNETIPS